MPLTLVLSTLGVVGAAPVAEAEEIQKAPDSCSHAHAILGWASFEEDDERRKKPWIKIGWIIGRLNWGKEKGKEVFKMLDDYEPGQVMSASFREYRVKGSEKGIAYVAHCGHGGTCNMLAERLFRLTKVAGTPRVYCGKTAIPKMLHNGSIPSIPIPSDEELNEDSGDVDDEEFDEDDDDDDDDDKKKDEDKDKKGKKEEDEFDD
jgi:hypothetical protein